MLGAILSILSIYIGFIFGIVCATILLILFGYSWGPLPNFYIEIIKFLQSFYPHAYPPAEDNWPGIIRRTGISSLEKHRNDSLSSFKFSRLPIRNVLDVCSDALKAGFESIIQDELSVAFNNAPPYYTTLLEWPFGLPFPDGPPNIYKRLYFGYIICFLFRYSILLPIRILLIISSFIFCSISVILTFFFSLTKQQKIYLGVTYCRIFCASIGLIAKYHNRQNRPKQPGICVSNHLSPNDIQIIFADVDPNSEIGYTITGQKHYGIIGAIESLVEKLCPAIWLERTNSDDRKRFMSEVIREGFRGGPVLLFPEGYCTNNTRIIQFRRAVFENGVTVYPIAIRQTARYGDSFWIEDEFWRYLVRIMSSWAIVYDVYYLEPMRMKQGEQQQEFAWRVQNQIAKFAEAECINFDGRLWYNKSEQIRMKDVQLQNLAKQITDTVSTDTTELTSN